MKKQILLVITFFSFLGFVLAQEPEKDVKKADRTLGLYFLDPKTNISKLWEAKSLIDGVADNPAVAEMYKTWITRGQIYNAVASAETDSMILYDTKKKSYNLKHPQAGVIAFQSLSKAKKLAVKSFEQKEVLNALSETSRYLNNFGTVALNKTDEKGNVGDYKSAYENFDAVIAIDQMLKDGGQQALFPKSEDLQKQKYIAAACAVSADMTDKVLPILEELRSVSYPEPLVYESLFNYYSSKSDSVKAEAALNEGRTKIPDDKSLLYAEINYFLNKGRLTELIEKLKYALKLEPNNLSIYNTLGNVYDNMCQKEWEQGLTPKGEELYKEAESYYTTALGKNINDFDLNYNLGALYYNKAAVISKEANKMSSDYSKEGTRKYNEKKAEMESYFDKALPYLEKAENLNSKDKSTLTALKEIYARKGQLDKSNAYKAKIEAAGSGK